MKLEIIIVNYNLKQATEILLNQLFKQTDPDFTITLIDQNSKESNTDKFINRWKDKLKFIQHGYNVSLNTIWNKAAQRSNADIICFLNNDVEICSNFVEHTKKIFEIETDLIAAIHTTNNPQYEIKTDLEYVVKQKYDIKQGWQFTLKKEWFINNKIPESLNFYFGDDFIFNNLFEQDKKIGIITSSPIIHHCSLTEKTNTELKSENVEKFKADRLEFNRLGIKHFLRNDFEYSKLHKKENHVLREPLPNNPKISCIMPVYLGRYKNCAENREEKFIRAVNSFINQNYNNKELIIISDACNLSEKIYYNHFAKFSNIKFEKTESRNKLFAGHLRNIGISISSGDIITYLDSDDFILNDHLQNIINRFEDSFDWIYYDDNIITSINSLHEISTCKYETRPVRIKISSIGTSAISHRSYVRLHWGDGYGHDWYAIEKVINLKQKKVGGSGYIVCHIPGRVDL